MKENGDKSSSVKNDALTLLLEISNTLAALHDSGILFQKTAEYSVELLKLGSSAIYLLDGERLCLQATFPALPPDFPDALRNAQLQDHPHIRQAISTMKPLVLPDTHAAEMTPAEISVIEMRNLRSLLYQPLIHNQKPLGVLIIGSVQKIHKFSAHEIDVCHALANQAALVIEETRLFEDNQRYIAELEREVEKRTQTKKNLLESESRFRLLAENARDLIYRMRLAPPRGFEYVSPAATAITGYTPAEHYADPDLGYKLVHPDDRHLLEEISAGKGDLTKPLTLRWVRKNGEVVWTEQRNVPIFDQQGNLVAIEGIARDITELKRMQTAEKELAQRIEAGLRAGNLAWWEMELPSGKVQFDSRKAEMLGYDPQRFKTYKSFTRLLHPDDRKKAMQAMQDHLDGKAKTYEMEYRIKTSDGSYKWFRDIGAITEHDPVSGRIRVVGIVNDISRRKEAEMALEAYFTKLEEQVAERTRALEEAQQELIAREKLATLGQLAGSVGHELRNPLGVISNAVYILQANLSLENEKAREYAQMIAGQVHRANKIISDLLNFAREPGASRSRIAVPDLVTRVLTDFPPPDDVTVKTRLSGDLPPVLADRQHMEQVLANLVSNAYQAMPQGGMLLVNASLKKNQVHIAVKDSGTGISPQDLPRLFTPLFTTKARGIGLGLATSKKLAEASGGRIEVKSESGKGSTFTLVLPTIGGQHGE